MKKVCVMVPSPEQAKSLCPNAANLRHRIIHEYAEVHTDIVRNEVPRLLENTERLLEEFGHD